MEWLHAAPLRARELTTILTTKGLYYLYSASQHIVLSNGNDCHSIREFADDVGKLHKHLGSLYSEVLDVDEAERQGQLSHVRDVLILGGRVLAESQLSDRWELIRARATQETDNVNEGLEYFRKLAAIGATPATATSGARCADQD